MRFVVKPIYKFRNAIKIYQYIGGNEKMALTEAKKNEWVKTLRELELLGAEESFEEHTAGDYWFFTSQTRGNIFFAQDKMIFISGWGFERIVIPRSLSISLESITRSATSWFSRNTPLCFKSWSTRVVLP